MTGLRKLGKTRSECPNTCRDSLLYPSFVQVVEHASLGFVIGAGPIAHGGRANSRVAVPDVCVTASPCAKSRRICRIASRAGAMAAVLFRTPSHGIPRRRHCTVFGFSSSTKRDDGSDGYLSRGAIGYAEGDCTTLATAPFVRVAQFVNLQLTGPRCEDAKAASVLATSRGRVVDFRTPRG
jgi:hypothetical protein